MGLWEGDAPEVLFAGALGVPVSGPPICAYRATFLSRSAPANDLAVVEYGEQSVLFFLGLVHPLGVPTDGTADEATSIAFAISSVAPTTSFAPQLCSTW